MTGEVAHQSPDGPAVGRCAVDALVQGAAKHRHRLAAGLGGARVLIDVLDEDAERLGPPAAGLLEVLLALLCRSRINVSLRVFRVRRLAVVALHVVLDGELPVGLDRIHVSLRNLRFGPAVHAGGARQRLLRRGEVERPLGKGREDQALDDPHREGLEASRRAIERLGHLLGDYEPAVQIVAPRMVGAGEATRGNPSRARRADARSAMTADVQQRFDFPLLGANDDHRLRSEVDHQELTRPRHARRTCPAQNQCRSSTRCMSSSNICGSEKTPARARAPRRMAANQRRQIERRRSADRLCCCRLAHAAAQSADQSRTILPDLPEFMISKPSR